MQKRNASRKPFGQNATILDVARRAGVSTATVSRVVASPDRVAEATRLRVLKAISDIGYTPNVSARNLRAKSTKMVLALVPGMSNSFFSPILNAVEDVLSEAGYGLIIGDTRHSAQRETHYARLIRAGQVDGVILLTGHLPRDEKKAGIEGIVPISLICIEIPGSRFPLFDVDNRRAARQMVEFLLAMGHRRIAHITGPMKINPESRERLKGYQDALAAAGISLDEALIWDGDFFAASGYAAAHRYFAAQDRPTAVFAGNDEMAMSFIKGLTDNGVSVPGDVSVTGFDDISGLELFIPALTTMRQPRAEMGRRAAVDLLERLGADGNVPPPLHERLDCALIVRDSVRRVGPPVPLAKPKARRAGQPLVDRSDVPA
jgi:LacI family repressor for deo operon, udp, cdd, tsx, nupC, and nupG